MCRKTSSSLVSGRFFVSDLLVVRADVGVFATTFEQTGELVAQNDSTVAIKVKLCQHLHGNATAVGLFGADYVVAEHGIAVFSQREKSGFSFGNVQFLGMHMSNKAVQIEGFSVYFLHITVGKQTADFGFVYFAATDDIAELATDDVFFTLFPFVSLCVCVTQFSDNLVKAILPCRSVASVSPCG